jgi:hypothetical protein
MEATCEEQAAPFVGLYSAPLNARCELIMMDKFYIRQAAGLTLPGDKADGWRGIKMRMKFGAQEIAAGLEYPYTECRKASFIVGGASSANGGLKYHVCSETIVGHALYDPSFLNPAPFGPNLNREMHDAMFQQTYDAVMNERRSQFAEVNAAANFDADESFTAPAWEGGINMHSGPVPKGKQWWCDASKSPGELGACVTETFRLEGESMPHGNAYEIVCNEGRLRTGPLMQNFMMEGDPLSMSETYTPPPPPVPCTGDDCICTDTTNGALDSGGDGCEYYELYPSSCFTGTYDDFDFTASDMCCACGGGFSASIDDGGVDDGVPGDGVTSSDAAKYEAHDGPYAGHAMDGADGDWVEYKRVTRKSWQVALPEGARGCHLVLIDFSGDGFGADCALRTGSLDSFNAPYLLIPSANPTGN